MTLCSVGEARPPCPPHLCGFDYRHAKVTYTIRRSGGERGTGELHTEMEARHIPGREEGDVPTPINLTNHAYWNLSGCVRRSVREHGLWLACDRYLPLDENQVMDAVAQMVEISIVPCVMLVLWTALVRSEASIGTEFCSRFVPRFVFLTFLYLHISPPLPS